jgi:hypothetical protein
VAGEHREERLAHLHGIRRETRQRRTAIGHGSDDLLVAWLTDRIS